MVGFFSLANKKKADLRHCKKVLSVQNTRLQVILNTQSLGTFSFKARIVKIHFFSNRVLLEIKSVVCFIRQLLSMLYLSLGEPSLQTRFLY